MKIPNIKIQLVIFLALFAIFLFISEKDSAFLINTSIALIAAIIADAVFNLIKNKKIIITDSSFISGLIVGFALSGSTAWWIMILASFAAMASKHLIRFQARHLFNPAAFGIFFVCVFFQAFNQWHGSQAWFILALFGIYFVYKIRKLEILLSYALVSLALFGAQAFFQKSGIPAVFGYLNYFFIFIMLIEPKTTPVSRMGKIIFATACACLIFVLRQAPIAIDVEILSLLVLNISVPLLNKIR